MKSKLTILLFCIVLAVAGCSSGTKSSSPSEQKITTINTMMSKGYVMSNNQKTTINKMLEDGRKLVSQGKTEEANKLFDEAIQLLEVIAETDRFNKSE